MLILKYLYFVTTHLWLHTLTFPARTFSCIDIVLATDDDAGELKQADMNRERVPCEQKQQHQRCLKRCKAPVDYREQRFKILRESPPPVSPEVSVRCTTAQNKRPTSEVINPEVRGEEMGVKMMRDGEQDEQRTGLKVTHTGRKES